MKVHTPSLILLTLSLAAPPAAAQSQVTPAEPVPVAPSAEQPLLVARVVVDEPLPASQTESQAAAQEPARQPGTEELRRAAAAAVGDSVGEQAPLFAGTPLADQARSVAWMLRVGDDRRLVALFPELQENGDRSLDERGAEARRRLEQLAGVLRERGQQVTPPRGLVIAQPGPAAPPPNFIPPEIFRGLERAVARGDNPEAQQALEEARAARRRAVEEP